MKKGKQGIFISLEGPDGSGKTTQMEILSERLKRNGYETITTKEPGGTEAGKKIRDLILYQPDTPLAELTEVLLYAADRAEHITRVIKPALAEGKIVLCDRYIHSNLAYQGYGLGYDLEAILKINQIATGGLWPDLSIFLDIAPNLGLDRAQIITLQEGNPVDRIEKRGIAFQKKVRLGYQTIAKADPQRIRLINTEMRSIMEIHEEIWGHVAGYIETCSKEETI